MSDKDEFTYMPHVSAEITIKVGKTERTLIVPATRLNERQTHKQIIATLYDMHREWRTEI